MAIYKWSKTFQNVVELDDILIYAKYNKYFGATDFVTSPTNPNPIHPEAVHFVIEYDINQDGIGTTVYYDVDTHKWEISDGTDRKSNVLSELHLTTSASTLDIDTDWDYSAATPLYGDTYEVGLKNGTPLTGRMPPNRSKNYTALADGSPLGRLFTEVTSQKQGTDIRIIAWINSSSDEILDIAIQGIYKTKASYRPTLVTVNASDFSTMESDMRNYSVILTLSQSGGVVIRDKNGYAVKNQVSGKTDENGIAKIYAHSNDTLRPIGTTYKMQINNMTKTVAIPDAFEYTVTEL